ncbi:helix-turn-helix domain-containing protein [Roseovarius aestuarii]|nr:helix-turn-helix domain-containing protein [Roseovarius aestuarii]
MPKQRRITNKERLKIQALIAEGESDASIARKLGRHRSTVTKIRLSKQKRSVTTGGQNVRGRVSDEEHAAFKAKTEALGITMSDGVRRLVRHSLDVLDLQAEEIDALAALRKELNAIGVNLNQLVTLAQSGRLSWNARDGKLVQQLDVKVDEAVNQLVAFVSASRQRAFVEAAFPIGGAMNE